MVGIIVQQKGGKWNSYEVVLIVSTFCLLYKLLSHGSLVAEGNPHPLAPSDINNKYCMLLIIKERN